jgi:hypothetical protein
MVGIAEEPLSPAPLFGSRMELNHIAFVQEEEV